MPAFRDLVRLRTRYLDDAVREGLAAGLDQVVLLGAGFDSRGLRMPEIAARGAAVYEIDLPDQLARKAEILRAAGVALPASIAYIPCDFATSDLGDTLLAALADRGFRRGAGAIFVWEGVLGYIDAAAVDRSLDFMTRAGGPGTRIAFTFVHPDFDPMNLPDRLRRAGLTMREDLGADALCRRYLPGREPPGDALAFHIGVAVL